MPARELALIETLPAEILQNIFLRTLKSNIPLACEANLPLASVTIAGKLSDYYTFSILCDEAFKPIPKPAHVSQYREREAQIRFQQRLFDIRWMRWGFFRWYLLRSTEARTCGCPVTITCFEGGGCKAESTHAESKYPPKYDAESPRGMPEIHCWLPDKLLRTPFTPSKLAFITCLLRVSKMSVNWASRDSINLSTAAKHSAIKDNNLPFVQLFSCTRRLCKAPNLNLVKFAVLEAGCARSVVFELMTSAREWGHRRWEDGELDVWSKVEEGRGNPKGAWVGAKLGELRGGSWPDAERGDYTAMGDVLVVRNDGLRGRGCMF